MSEFTQGVIQDRKAFEEAITAAYEAKALKYKEHSAAMCEAFKNGDMALFRQHHTSFMTVYRTPYQQFIPVKEA